jgi:hypothetical protein
MDGSGKKFPKTSVTQEPPPRNEKPEATSNFTKKSHNQKLPAGVTGAKEPITGIFKKIFSLLLNFVF